VSEPIPHSQPTRRGHVMHRCVRLTPQPRKSTLGGPFAMLPTPRQPRPLTLRSLEEHRRDAEDPHRVPADGCYDEP